MPDNEDRIKNRGDLQRPSHDSRGDRDTDPLLVLRGSGKELWADKHADEYVNDMREGWE